MIDKIGDFKKEKPEKKSIGFIWSSLKDTTDIDTFKYRLNYFFEDYVEENQSTMIEIKNEPIYVSLVKEFLSKTKYRLDKTEETLNDVKFFITKVKNERS